MNKDAVAIFHHLETIISGEYFLDHPEVYICPYSINEHIDMEKNIKLLQNNLKNKSINVLHINLYDLCIDVLKKGNDWDWYIKNEQTLVKTALIAELRSILDIENTIMPAIAEKIQQSDYDVFFITGVGEVYPYIRSHSILNNIQKTANKKPLILFFPGEYTSSPNQGSSLDLFGELKGDKYYRAINICDKEA